MYVSILVFCAFMKPLHTAVGCCPAWLWQPAEYVRLGAGCSYWGPCRPCLVQAVPQGPLAQRLAQLMLPQLMAPILTAPAVDFHACVQIPMHSRWQLGLQP